MVAVQAQGPEFDPLYPHKKMGMKVCVYNPSTGEAEMGGSPGLPGYSVWTNGQTPGHCLEGINKTWHLVALVNYSFFHKHKSWSRIQYDWMIRESQRLIVSLYQTTESKPGRSPLPWTLLHFWPPGSCLGIPSAIMNHITCKPNKLLQAGFQCFITTEKQINPG